MGWQVVDGALSSSAANDSATLIGIDWPHLLFSADVRIASGSAVNILLRSSAENYSIGLEISGRTTLSRSGLLLAESAPIGDTDAWRTVQIQALGGLVTVAVDGVVQFSHDDSPGLGAGAIGFISGGSVAVDNVAIIRLDAPTEPPPVVVVPTEAPTAEPTVEVVTVEPTLEATEIVVADAPPVIVGLAPSYDAQAGEPLSLTFSVSDDADLVAIAANTDASTGKVALSAVGSSAPPFNTNVNVQYFPADGFSGLDQFTITATDFAGNVVSADVQVNVAEALAAAAETVLTPLLSYNFDDGEIADLVLRPGWSVVGGTLQATRTAEAADIVTEFFSGAIETRLLLNSGTFNLSFRQQWQEFTESGYTATFRASGEVALSRNGVTLDSAPVAIAGQWRTIRVSADDGDLSISVDGSVVLNVTDTDALPAGIISFTAPETVVVDENAAPSIVQLDDVVVLADSPVAPSALPGDPLPAPPGTANLGDRVWIDTNSDGLQTAGELGLANVNIYAYQVIGGVGNYVTLDVTDANGNFEINVPSGFTYYLRIEVPAGYILTNPNVSGTAVNSDFDTISFTTGNISTASGADYYNYDAGLIELSPCQADTALDIMLVLDSSGSIGSNDYKLMKNFATGLVQSFTFGPNAARFGVIQFSSPGLGVMEVGLSTNQARVLTEIREMTQRFGNTDIGEGLRMAQNELRRDGRDVKFIPRAIILLTDGYGNGDQEEFVRAVNGAKNAKTLIYGIGVGGYNLAEIQYIASDPDSRFVFTINNFAGLVQSLRTVSNSTCNTPLIPYAAPELLTPAKNGFTNDNTPFFSWGSVPFTSDRYDGYFNIQVDNNASFVSPEFTGSTAALSTSPVTALPDGKYYWRVQAGNVLGVGPWSKAASFTVDILAPGTPTQISPANDATTTNARQGLTWSAVNGANRYHVQIDNNSDFSSPIYNDDTRTTPSFTPPASLPLGTYSWRVRAFDAAGNFSPWTLGRTYNINILKTPANNAVFVSATPYRPTFTWQAVPGAVNYGLVVATTPSFGASNVYGTQMTGTTHKLPALNALGYGIYYWRINLDLGSGFAGGPFYRQFTVTPPAPAKPVLVNPANLAALNTATPNLTWNAVPYSYAGVTLTYEVQVDNNSTFASPERTTTTAGLNYAISPGLPDGNYYWRVRAVNSLGFAGQYSTARRFVIDTAAPSTATLNTPADGALLTTTRPQLKWFVAPGATQYRVQIDNSASFASPEVNAFPVAATSYTPPVSLPQTLYYWRVQAVDAAGNLGAWSAVRSFTINISLTPANAAFIVSASNAARPTFTWSAATGALTYQIAVATTPSFGATTIYNFVITGTTHTLPAANALTYGTYYWRVNLDLGSGSAAPSTSRQFTVTPPAPPAPTLLTPANNSSTNDTTPTLTWNSPLYTYSALSYEVQISRNTTFTNLVTTASVGAGTTNYTPAPLLPGIYYWRVRAINNQGLAGAFAAYRKVTVTP